MPLPLIRQFHHAVTAMGAALGLAKRIDYKTLNRYVIGMNSSLTLDHVLSEAARCLKDLLDYQLFAFAVQHQDRAEAWIDPRAYQDPLRKVIKRDFGPVHLQEVHFLSQLADNAAQPLSFSDARLLSHVIMSPHGLARLYVLPQRRMLPYHEDMLAIIVKTLGIALNNCLSVKRLESDAALDPLTGCYNRRAYDRMIEHQVAGAHRHDTPMSLIMFDIDHFKQVNDNLGHPAGDAVLAQVAGAVRRAIRQGDYLVRYGGEEFLVILPETRLVRALDLARRLKAVLETLDIHLPDGNHIRKTASFGVACLKPGWDNARLVKEADTMLYQAKTLGRNRVMPKLDLFLADKNTPPHPLKCQ